MTSRLGSAAVLTALLLLGACATTPERAASGCQDISGILGREFRWSFGLNSSGAWGSSDMGTQIGSTFPPISQEFRETLIMGDHLCRAAELGLIDAEAYERFVDAQFAGLSAVAQQQGDRSEEEIAGSQTRARAAILGIAPPRLRAELTSPHPDRDGAEPMATPFERAREIYSEVESSLPPNVSAPFESASYDELRSRVGALEARVDGFTPPATHDFAIDTLGNVYFALNSSELDAAARREVESIVRAVGVEAQLRLEGFADPSGSFEHNRALSEARANAVAGYLRELGVVSVVMTIGSGRTDQFGDAASNRRVTIQRVAD